MAAENPFRSGCIERLDYRFSRGSWDALLVRVNALNRRGAILGPHGSGKTTLLEQLRARLQAAGERCALLRLVEGERGGVTDWIARTPVDAILLLDGAGRLNPVQRTLAVLRSRRHRGFIVTAHGQTFLPVLWRCGPEPDVVLELFRQLAPDVARTMSAASVEIELRRHGGNVRELFREWYDRWGSGRLPTTSGG